MYYNWKAKNPNYNSTNNTQFTALQNQVDEVKDVMTNNIDSILQRGDRLEDLVDKTSELETTVNLIAFYLVKLFWLIIFVVVE